MYSHTNILLPLIKATIGEPKTGCEIGVWRGGNSYRLLKTFKKLNLLMVDRYKEYDEKEKMSSRVTGRASQEVMYTYLRNTVSNTMFACNRRILMIGTSLLASKIVQDESLDFVFIDAGHTYEEVSSDIKCWFPKVRKGGLVSGHDYGGRKNRRGLFGVNIAVDEFTKANNYEVLLSPATIWSFMK